MYKINESLLSRKGVGLRIIPSKLGASDSYDIDRRIRRKAKSSRTVGESNPEYDSLPTSPAYVIEGVNGQPFADSVVITFQKNLLNLRS
jgi:hypothetical protein